MVVHNIAKLEARTDLFQLRETLHPFNAFWYRRLTNFGPTLPQPPRRVATQYRITGLEATTCFAALGKIDPQGFDVAPFAETPLAF